MQYKNNQLGRSMIEMLGVLAIVGVLSIGGILGYSKAIYKHKLNKQAEQYNTIISAFWENENSLVTNSRVASDTTLSSAPFFVLGIIPNEMQKGNGARYFYDIFDNRAYIRQGGESQYYYIAIDIQNKSFEQCKNIIEVAKAYYEFVPWVTVYPRSSVYGNSYCIGNRKCLKDMTPVQMEQMCDTCKIGDTCSLWIYLGSAIGNNSYFNS